MKTYEVRKTTRSKRIITYAGLTTLVIVATLISLYCYAVSTLDFVLGVF
jgi:hypothetical protein